MRDTETESFYTLSPDVVLDALATLQLFGDGRLLALNSYENRVYQVGMEEGPPVIVKFYRPGRWTDAAILEEHALAAELVDDEVPVVQPWRSADGHTLHHHAGFRFAVFPRQGGRTPELDMPGVLSWIGRFIGRLHVTGAKAAFSHRPQLNPDTFGAQPVAWLSQHGQLPGDIAAEYFAAARLALDGVARCYERAGEVATIRLHGDCHIGNILWTDAGPHFVDLDDARTGPALQDCWMLLSGSRQEMSQQLGELMDGYEQFAEFNPRQLHLLEALRTLRLIHYATWLTQRRDDPAFLVAFPEFGNSRYWQQRTAELQEQARAMEEPPLWPS